MAQRFYFEDSVPPVSPAFDGGWEVTGSALRRTLSTNKDAAAVSLITLAVATALNSPAGAVDGLFLQLVGPPLNGAGTLSGAWKGQARFLENSATADMRVQAVLKVVSNDGSTVRGTLIGMDTGALSQEFATALTNRPIFRAQPVTPTSVAYVDGDRVVLELGFRKHENAANNRTAQVRYGSLTGTDLPEDSTTTTDNIPWLETADSPTFKTSTMRTTDAVLHAGLIPTSGDERVTDAVVHAGLIPTSGEERVSDVVVHAGMIPTSGEARVTGVKVDVAMLNPTYNAIQTRFRSRVVG